MGLAYSWGDFGATTFYTEAPHPGSGEGDSSRGPFPERGYPEAEAYPTLMIEAGFSSPLEYLQFKAKWWFSMSNHDIKIVVLAKFYGDKRTIALQRWEERQQGLRAGAATTRWGSKWVASCHQEITITITESSENPPVYQVAGGDLVLSFQQLFLRNPQAGEGDVVIPVIELQWYAARVWSQVV